MSLRLEGDTLLHEGSVRWSLRVADLRIIAEMTTDYGPFVDDWLVVLVSSDGRWREVPLDSGVFDVLASLAPILGAEAILPFALCGSVEMRSHILWPAELAGEPVFRVPRWFAWTWPIRLHWARCGGRATGGLRLTDAAQRALSLQGPVRPGGATERP